MKFVAVRIDYTSPRTGIHCVERHAVKVKDTRSTRKMIEALQRRMMKLAGLNRVPSVTWQLCDDWVSSIVKSNQL